MKPNPGKLCNFLATVFLGIVSVSSIWIVLAMTPFTTNIWHGYSAAFCLIMGVMGITCLCSFVSDKFPKEDWEFLLPFGIKW